MKKYLIIVDPLSSGALYAPLAKQYDLTPIAILTHNPPLEVYRSSVDENDFEKTFTFDSIKTHEFYRELKSWVKDNVRWVLAGAECGVELADQVAMELCPEFANDKSLSLCRRNKHAMGQRLSQLDIASPLSIRADSAEHIIQWVTQHQLMQTGVVVKPLNSGGTDGVFACFNDKDIQHATDQLLGKTNQLGYVNDTVLAQEFMQGTEYVVDTVSIRGKHIVTNICQYQKTNANGSNFVYDYLDFLPETGQLQNDLAEYAFSVLDALGMKNGPAHSEIMMTPDVGLRLVEVGARLHGGIAITAARLATGTSQLDQTVQALANNLVRFKNCIHFRLKKFTRIVFLISHFEKNVVTNPNLFAEIEKLASYSPNSLKLNFKLGDILQKTIDLYSIAGLLILNHSSQQQLEHDYQTIRELEKGEWFTI
jgi:biotin carboxylase